MWNGKKHQVFKNVKQEYHKLMCRLTEDYKVIWKQGIMSEREDVRNIVKNIRISWANLILWV